MSESHESSRWKGRVALVTGASSGIGEAIAEMFVEVGMKVAICARRQERIEAFGSRLTAAGGVVLPITCNLRHEKDILAMFERVRGTWGGVDVLVNNAGLGHLSPLMDGDTDKWREMLEVNVLALCICTREAVRDMRARGDDGHVIHISSMAAHRVRPRTGVYSATKFAVRSLTEGLRQELREADSRIRVSSVSPGMVETGFAEHYHGSADKAREFYSQIRVLRPRDVADAVRFILLQPSHAQVHDLLIRPTEQRD